MNPQFWWFVSRASGLVAWVLLTLSLLAGILLPGRILPKQRPAWILDIHRWLGGLMLSFVAIHLLGLYADTYEEFTWPELFVPLASDWKPVAVALGVVAFWLLLLVQLTSLARKALPKRVWRSIHLASYAGFFLGAIHGTLSGTDAGTRTYVFISLFSIIMITGATVWRVLLGRRETPKGHPGVTLGS